MYDRMHDCSRVTLVRLLDDTNVFFLIVLLTPYLNVIIKLPNT